MIDKSKEGTSKKVLNKYFSFWPLAEQPLHEKYYFKKEKKFSDWAV
jgi:hypothetical protein